MKTKLLALFLFSVYSMQGQDVTGIYKRYTGTVEKKIPVTVDLMITDSLVLGHYYYNNAGEQLLLKGSRKNETIKFDETTDTATTGFFNGKITPDLSAIEGKWYNPSKTKSYPFALKSFLPEGSVELNALSKPLSYEWYKNKNGESLGYTANFTYCYVVNMADKTVQKKINEVLLSTDMSGNESPSELKEKVVSSMEDEFSNYTDEYSETFPDSIAEENMQYMDESPHIYQWKVLEKMSVLYDENNILCVELFTHNYTGGLNRHGAYNYETFNLVTGELVTLEDIFKPDVEEELAALAEQQLQKDGNIDDKTSLTRDDLSMEDALFYINHAGIGLNYILYELVDNRVIRIFLKWDQVKSLINPAGPLGWAIK